MLEKFFVYTGFTMGFIALLLSAIEKMQWVAFLLALSGCATILFSSLMEIKLSNKQKKIVLGLGLNIIALFSIFSFQQYYIVQSQNSVTEKEIIPVVRLYTEEDYNKIQIGDTYLSAVNKLGEGHLEYEEINQYDGKLYQTYSWGDSKRGYLVVSVVNGVIDYKHNVIGE